MTDGLTEGEALNAAHQHGSDALDELIAGNYDAALHSLRESQQYTQALANGTVESDD